MKQDKNERLIIRISANLKKSIEDLAEKQNITASELVRKVLEDAVCKKEKEIEQCALMVNTIAKHINNLTQEIVFASMSPNVYRLTKELRNYKKLSYSHQLSAIEMIIEEKIFNDTKVQSLKKDFDDALKALNSYVEKSSKHSESDKTFENTQERINMLEDRVWDSTFKLYTYLTNKYFSL